MRRIILTIVAISVFFYGCSKNVSVQDVQEGTQHVSNIINGKNASEVFANLAHASNDISQKLKESGIK